jgi:two-component system chemotaxis sensor kinase CheA
VLPFVSLARLLGASGARGRNGQPRIAVLVRGDAGVAALGVDRMLGTTTVVLRPLPELAPASPIVAGAALDAEGNPQLVLDPDALVAEARRAQPSEAEPVRGAQSVLVIDDSLTTRMLEQSILESAGYDVHLATSGEEALEKARARRYALFLVDVEMPGMDGFTFLEHKRADPTLRDIPAILVTSRGAPEDVQRGRDAGACHYVVKSEFDQAQLLERIRALVG